MTSLDKINVLIELLNNEAKFGKFHYEFVNIHNGYGLKFYYIDYRNKNKKINYIRQEWCGELNDDTMEAFVNHSLKHIFKYIIFAKTCNDVFDYRGIKILFVNTQDLLTKGCIYENTKP